MGENVTTTLRGNPNFDWVVLNDRDRYEGVKSGAYYAAVVIPKKF